MGRPQRFHFNGAIYHAMARSVDRRDIYTDDTERIQFLKRMRRLEENAGAKILAYCLMNNHFHLAIQVGTVTLSSIMQRLEGHYGSWFNHRHGRDGHLFQGRFKAFNCLDERYLFRLIPYIHMNPVRAGLVKHPGDWPWSSFTGRGAPADDLSDFDPWPKDGTREFDLTRLAQTKKASLESISERVAAETGFGAGTLRARGYARPLIAARRMFVGESLRAGYSQRAIAEWLGSTRSAISRFALKVGSGRSDTIL